MRHRKSGRKLGRKTGPRRALVRSLVRNLFLANPNDEAGHMERIITTPAKAREARRLAERVITLGKRGDFAARRRAMKILADRDAVRKVFEVIGPRYVDRPGGYTRILHWHTHRLGDNAPQVLFELVEAEMRVKEKTSAPAAPKAPEPQASEEPEPAEQEALQAEEAPARDAPDDAVPEEPEEDADEEP